MTLTEAQACMMSLMAVTASAAVSGMSSKTKAQKQAKDMAQVALAKLAYLMNDAVLVDDFGEVIGEQRPNAPAEPTVVHVSHGVRSTVKES